MLASESAIVLALRDLAVGEALAALDRCCLAGLDLPLVAHDLVADCVSTLIEETTDHFVRTVDRFEVRRHTCTES